jgi:thiol:disulfide interchange protein DsbD
MKSKLLFALALVLLFLAVLPLFRGSGGSIDWYSEPTLAFDEAAEAEQEVLVFLYTDWCTYCKQMDQTTFKDPSVLSQMADNYVWLRLNAESDPEGIRMQRKFFVSGFPTLLILDSSGREIDRLQGFIPPSRFAREVQQRIRS